MKKYLYIWIPFLFFLTACSNFIVVPSPTPTEPIRIGITPYLSPLFRILLMGCIQETSDTSIILDEIPTQSINQEGFHIIIQIGEPKENIDMIAVLLGWEDIIFIASPDLNKSTINIELIKDAYTSPMPYHTLWTYPQNHELQEFFDINIIGGEKLTPYGLIVSNPGEMVEAIIKTKNSIGYIPKSWYQENVQIIPFDTSNNHLFRQPILALMRLEITNTHQNLLTCLQNRFQNDQ